MASDSLSGSGTPRCCIGGTATRADRTGEALEIIEAEIKRMAERRPDRGRTRQGQVLSSRAPTRLTLDTSTKIATQLVQIQLDDLGIDYIERRGA